MYIELQNGNLQVLLTNITQINLIKKKRYVRYQVDQKWEICVCQIHIKPFIFQLNIVRMSIDTPLDTKIKQEVFWQTL